jgi:hypothetical protein
MPRGARGVRGAGLGVENEIEGRGYCGRPQFLRRAGRDQTDSAEVPVLPRGEFVSDPLEGAVEEGQPAPRRGQGRREAICQRPELHGARGRPGGVPEHSLPETVRDIRAERGAAVAGGCRRQAGTRRRRGEATSGGARRRFSVKIHPPGFSPRGVGAEILRPRNCPRSFLPGTASGAAARAGFPGHRFFRA